MEPSESRSPRVGVVMGSQSDWETMRHAADVLTGLGIAHENRIVSAHRTPERLYQYAREAEGRGLEVLIAGAGGAAHLPGMLAAMTLLPVLGVPVQSRTLKGVDSLLSIVQMPQRRASWNAGHRRLRSGQRRASGRGDPGTQVSGRASVARRLSQVADRRGRGVSVLSGRNPAAVLHPPASLGVIGGGQLGRMFIQAAQRMGFRRTLCPTEDAPAAQVAHWSVVAPPDQLAGLRRFADQAEAVTIEFENVSAPALRWLERAATGARPAGGRCASARTGCVRRGSSRIRGSRTRPGEPVSTHERACRGRRGSRAAPDPQDGVVRVRRQGASPGQRTR